MIDEKELLKDTVDKLMDEYSYSREDAEEWCEIHLEYCIEEMFNAQSNYIASSVRNTQVTTDSCLNMKVVFGVDRDT